MKRTMKKLVSLGLAAVMSLTMLVGCGSSNEATNDTSTAETQQEETKPAGDVKIGVLVQDVSGEEALGYRSYY